MTSVDPALRHCVGQSDEMKAERAERGWSREDTWSFDTYLAGIIAGGCRALAQRGNGYPPQLTPEEWSAILNRIADAFEWYVEGAFTVERGGRDKAKCEEFEAAFGLLCEWWGALWD